MPLGWKLRPVALEAARTILTTSSQVKITCLLPNPLIHNDFSRFVMSVTKQFLRRKSHNREPFFVAIALGPYRTQGVRIEWLADALKSGRPPYSSGVQGPTGQRG